MLGHLIPKKKKKLMISHVSVCSDSGEMCAMKEVTLFSDDSKSKESAKQLAQVGLLCR